MGRSSSYARWTLLCNRRFHGGGPESVTPGLGDSYLLMEGQAPRSLLKSARPLCRAQEVRTEKIGAGDTGHSIFYTERNRREKDRLLQRLPPPGCTE